MPNGERYERVGKPYPIESDVSGVSPLKKYEVAASLVNGLTLLDLCGNGTRCADLGKGKIEILSDKSEEDIAKKLKIPVKHVVYVP